MEDKRNEDPIMIPYYVHEGMMARMERVNRRFWILCIILFLGLVITNAGWIVYEAQFEDVVTTETYESDASDGGVAIANGAGEVSYLATAKYTKKTRTRRKKTGGNTGYMVCKNCGGDGRVKVRK